MTNEKTFENRIRSKARRMGWRLCKARGMQHVNNQGLYMLADDHNTVYAGDRYDLDLPEAEAILDAQTV